jgi:VanZ family protein
VLKKHIFKFAFVLWMALVTVLCLISFPDDGLEVIKFAHMDKVVHFTFYFVASILGSLALREAKGGAIPFKRAMAIIFILLTLYGIVIEVLQNSFTTDRSGDVFDAITNTVGALTGICILKLVFSLNTQLKWKN